MNWPTRKLGEICDINGGDAAPQDYAVFSSDGIPFVRMQDLGRYHVTDNLIETRDKIKTEAINKLRIKIFPKGSIILPRSGSVFANHRAILGVDAVVVSHIAILNNYKGVEPRYLFWYLTKLDIGRHAVKTSNVDSISFQRLGKFEIPIPALNIQTQIVERLGKIAEARKLNDELIQKSDELFQSLLHQELNPAGKNWEVKKLVEILKPQYGYTTAAKEAGNYRFIRITDIGDDGELRDFDKKYVTLKPNEAKNYQLRNGDLLLARTGATFGKILYFKENELSIFASFLIRLNPDTSINPFYIWLFSHSQSYWRQAKSLMTGSGQPQFNANKLKQIKIPLPPLETQKQIVEKLSAVREYKKQLFVQRAKLKELFDSVLTKSMSGEYEKSKFTPLDTKLSNRAQRPH